MTPVGLAELLAKPSHDESGLERLARGGFDTMGLQTHLVPWPKWACVDDRQGWKVPAVAGYGPDGDVFLFANPAADDPRGVMGMQLTGVKGKSGRIYSEDLRGKPRAEVTWLRNVVELRFGV